MKHLTVNIVSWHKVIDNFSFTPCVRLSLSPSWLKEIGKSRAIDCHNYYNPRSLCSVLSWMVAVYFGLTELQAWPPPTSTALGKLTGSPWTKVCPERFLKSYLAHFLIPLDFMLLYLMSCQKDGAYKSQPRTELPSKYASQGNSLHREI